jgi:CRP/FNR family transcriptional regulator, cyclic AMP receptor protein
VDAARLKKIDRFASFPDEDVERLAGVADEVSIDEGESLVRAGTPPDQLYVIEEGSVEVKRDDETIAKLGPGDVVGERGVLKRGLRNATVVATSPVRAIFITSSQVRQLRQDHPDLDERLQGILDERDED